jgi:uncharacterized protein YggT (Ycf19 family)
MIDSKQRLGVRASVPVDPYQPMQEEIIDARQPSQERKSVWRSYNAIWFFVGLIVSLLAFRFVFELLGANPYNAFVQLIYTLSYPFAAPFQSIFGITSIAHATFDWSLLVAMIVYFFIGYALVQILRIIHPVTSDDVRHRIRTV